MNTERAPPGGRSRRAVVLLAASLLSILLGFRLGMNRQDVVGFGLQIPAPGLDLSYTYAFNRASAEGRVFGRDFVSTYGPYGYFIAAMDVPGIVVPWILSQLLLTIALGLAALAYAYSIGGRLVSMVAGAVLLLMSIHVLADEYRWQSLVLLLVLLGLHAKGRAALVAFAIAGFLAGFCLLVKLSLGSGALLTVIAAAFLTRSLRATASRLGVSALSAAAGLNLGLWLHQGSLDGLAGYLTTASAVTRGYSSAMSLAEPDWWKAGFAFAVFAGCLGAALFAPGRSQLRLAAAALVAPTFVAWKHGVVRQDGHVQTLVFFGLVLGAVALVEVAGGSGLRRACPWLLLAAVALVRVWLQCPYSGPGPFSALGETLLQPIRLPGLRGLVTLTGLSAYRAGLERESVASLESLRLPEPERQLIGSQSVDVYPWETSYVAANGLHWTSRPSPASFAAYTPSLDRLDAAFFEGESRPSFVLWHRAVSARSIDRRHLFWDEPLTFRTLLDRYDLASRGAVLLLRARARPRFAPPARLQTVTVDWGQPLRLPRVDGALLAEVEIDTPFPALLRRVLLREEPAYMVVGFANGERARFRYVPDQVRTGLWIQPLARNAADVAAIFSGGCPQSRAREVRFLEGFRPGARGPRVTFWRLPGAAGPVFECGGG
jgi:hypothetical protein